MPRKKYWKKSRAKAVKGPISDEVVLEDPSDMNRSVDRDCNVIAMDIVDSDSDRESPIFHQIRLKGSFHQGDERFMPNSGRQCTCCALMFLHNAQMKPLHYWSADDLDKVLVEGDELYGHIQRSSTISAAHLLINELPEYISASDDSTFRLSRHQPNSGLLWPAEGMGDFGGFVDLEVALERGLIDHSSCFVNFCDAVFAVVQRGGSYFVFDSHSRNEEGTMACDGTSVLMSYSSVHGVYEHCMRLASSMNAHANTMFEVTPVSIYRDHEMETMIENLSTLQHTHETGSAEMIFSDIENCETERESLVDENVMGVKQIQRKEYVKKIIKREKRRKVLSQNAPKLTKNQRSQIAKEKYKSNEEYRSKLRSKSVEKYAHNQKFRERVKDFSVQKYRHNENFRESVKSGSTAKYRRNRQFREATKSSSTSKYQGDKLFREAVKSASISKYKGKEQFREAVKSASIAKYKGKEQFREAVKSASIAKYQKNEQFREALKRAQTVKYKTNATFRHQVRKRNMLSRNRKTALNVMAGFRRLIAQGPEKLKSGKKPAEAVVNNLQLHDIPKQLSCLNNLEQHLVAVNIPFMKLMSLPKGQQNAVHGPTVAVPSNIKQTTTVLPRVQTSDQMIRVKLKRKLAYKGHYEYQYVNKENIRAALSYLKESNIYYRDIDFNNDWINPHDIDIKDDDLINPDTDAAVEIVEDVARKVHSDHASGSKSNSASISKEISEDESNENGLLLDTCLQPIDIGQDILDNNYENIINISPCENNIPVAISSDKTNEAKCFPVLFPKGTPTFHDEREERLTLARYLNTRLLNADGRFARSTDYIFYAQYLSELEQVKSNIQISIRKGTASKSNRKIVASDLANKESLSQILKHDEGYKFLKPIRGTPPFWQSVQKDLFAMIRQLGIPTWFCSFSSAELRWNEIIDCILRETSDTRKAQDLDWNSKCSILRKNPVTAARMFDHRFHAFLRDVIMSPAAPIGKVIDFFFRVEFQQRGSPHTHCLFWIENAPKIDSDSDEAVVNFVDKYVSCEMPENENELSSIVDSVQTHSKRHTKTCRKGGKTCRFNFPRPPSCKTFISHSQSNKETKTVDDLPKDAYGNPDLRFLGDILQPKMSTKTAEEILNEIWREINDNNQYDSTESLFEAIDLTQEDVENACAALGKRTSLVLQRRPNDVWINQYNPALLKCWNANMDIQYVIDAYSCVVYIISYISKAEREMGLLLAQTEKEARSEDNINAKLALKKLGHTYLTHREVSAQEAVYRVCNMHLKENSRFVQFVPVGMNRARLSLPLETLKQKCSSGKCDEDDMWATSIIDRYTHRPSGEEMDKLCLAQFCSEYRIVAQTEMARVSKEKRRTPVITLQKGLGFMQKRTNSKPAVIRYPRFSQMKDSEKYHHSMLQLFLPYRVNAQLKPPTFESHERFYHEGSVKIGTTIQLVKTIVDENKALFENDADELDRAEEILGSAGCLEDAWSQICPETEMERQECEDLQQNVDDEGDYDCNIPDLQGHDHRSHECTTVPFSMSKTDAQKILQSLNSEQSAIFYMVRQWALEKRNSLEPKPFHLCVHGPGGTGKSLLIKAIHYECNRLLAKCRDNPDDISVLLCAPTGVAAFNIDAQTIHSAFSIGIDAYWPYIPLSEEKINTLRRKYQSVQLLIIDEISMVDHKLLSYIHGRLKQIKQTPNDVPFGNVSILAVGDFYQLPPVKGRPLFAENVGVDYWNQIFVKAELTQIMRQRNLMFAEMLNRLRVHDRDTPLQPEDIDTLKGRETGSDMDCVHIFPRNKQVDEFNEKMLIAKCSNVITIEAEDVLKQRQTNVKLRRMCGSFALPQKIKMGIGARVMLTRNIDTSDGLVNGVFGTVSHLLMRENERKPMKIFIEFDNCKVGAELRKKTHFPVDVSVNSTPVEVQEETARNGAGVRRQFPLKLAWACTVHKTQGLTFDQISVSFDGIKTPGQAPPTYQMTAFKNSMRHLMERLDETFSCGMMIVGDFNDNTRTSSSIENFMSHLGFIQNVTEATTEDNTIIDHVYTR
ncbi:uncharacterized protein, partial [Haliotis asinina]|uniref:uncharacterized protein n=1 Tax=Haliotis asinina TaxID=109174 RepID=UPI003531E2DD